MAELGTARRRVAPVVERTRDLLRNVRWKLFVAPRATTIGRVQARKAEHAASGRTYAEQPRVSVIVQSFNQVRNVGYLESRLRRTCADELIVCEDGSLDGSDEAWLARLTRPNDFLIHSNDIHEIRSYSRAIDYARGEFVCLMQDDDRPPADGTWLAKALKLFDHFPKLAVLGGWCGFNQYFAEEYNAPWLPDGAGAIPFIEPRTKQPLMFVENVNIGPYLLRRRVYDELGGFDLRFSPPGEPGITFEAEFCYRAWRARYQVALTDIPVKARRGERQYIFPGGTFLWGQDARERNEVDNKARIADLYDRHLPGIQASIRQLNSRELRRTT